MAKCACGMDHAKERRKGARAEYKRRVEESGEPFELIHEGVYVRKGQPLELRATQRDDGSWDAWVYQPDYAENLSCEVGSIVFSGIAATEPRAQQLARDGAATWLRTTAQDHARFEAERRTS